jgi:hypothetical protein
MSVGVTKCGSSSISSCLPGIQHELNLENEKKMLKFLYPNFHLKFAGSFFSLLA